MLAHWTEQGASKASKSPTRLDAAKKLLADMGGEIKLFYMTMGRYDLIVVYEAPDDAVAARFTLRLGMLRQRANGNPESVSGDRISGDYSLPRLDPAFCEPMDCGRNHAWRPSLGI